MDSAQANARGMPRIVEDTRLRITDNREIGPKEGKRLNDTREFSSVVGVVSGSCVREMCFGCDDRAEHDILAIHEESGRWRPNQLRFRPQRHEFLHLCKWPILESRCLFLHVVARGLKRFGYLAFDSQQAKLLVKNNKQASSQAKGLVRMGVCRSDSSHMPNSPFHAVSEIPWIIQMTAVMIVGANKGVDNTHNHNSILEGLKRV